MRKTLTLQQRKCKVKRNLHKLSPGPCSVGNENLRIVISHSPRYTVQTLLHKVYGMIILDKGMFLHY